MLSVEQLLSWHWLEWRRSLKVEQHKYLLRLRLLQSSRITWKRVRVVRRSPLQRIKDLLNKHISGPLAPSSITCTCALVRYSMRGLCHHHVPGLQAGAQLTPISCWFCTYSASFYQGQSLCRQSFERITAHMHRYSLSFLSKLLNKIRTTAFHTPFSC